MNKNKNPIFSLRLAPEEIKTLDVLSKKLGISRTDIIRLAIKEFKSKKS